MSLRPPSLRLIRGLLGALLLVWAIPARTQNLVLHLKNGDHLTGSIVSENTNEVLLSTCWITNLAVPVSQIESRELLPIGPTNSAAGLAQVPVQTNSIPTTNVAAKLALARTAAGPAAASATNDWWHRWKGDISLGTDLIFGSSDQQIYFGHLKLNYAQPYRSDPKEFFRNELSYDGEYGRTDGLVTANRMDGSSKTDFDLGRRPYVYNLGRIGYDEIRKINLGYEEGPGFGYHVVTRSNFVANAELGADYQQQNRSDGTTTKDVYFRLAEDSTWKVNDHITFTEKIEFMPRYANLTQFRSRIESTLAYGFLKNLSLNFTVLDFYDTEPAEGVKHNQFEFRSALGYKF